MKTLQPLLALMFPHWKRLFLGISSLFVTTACMLTLPRYLQHIFDAALTSKNLTALNHVMFFAFVTAIVLVLAMFMRSYFIRYTSDLMIYDLRKKLFAHTLSLDLATFENRSAGEIISRLLTDISIIREFVYTSLPMFLRGILLATGAFSALLLTNAWLTLYIFLAALPVFAVATVFGKRWRKSSSSIQHIFAEMSGRVEEIINAIRTVKSSANDERELKSINYYMDNMLCIMKGLIFSQAGFAAFNIFIGFIAIMSVLYLGGREVILGNMTIGHMMSFILYLAFLGDGAGSIATFWPSLNNVLGSTERVFELLNEEASIVEPEHPKHLPDAATNARSINIKDLTFFYPSRTDTPALQNINLTIKAGETVAIVGPSGAGKTTLFSLLLRLYDAHSGVISIDHTPITDLSFKELRSTFATVSQDTHIFATTIADNIAYTKPNASQEEIIKASQQANAHDFIMALPHGYQTEVGEKGVRLSGGQKQRIAIARAILQNAPILLLDEATSHLDAASEQAVQAALDTLQEQRTVLVVAHRLATVKNADRIVLLNRGKIEAEGTHAELLKKCALYKKLATLQFLDA